MILYRVEPDVLLQEMSLIVLNLTHDLKLANGILTFTLDEALVHLEIAEDHLLLHALVHEASGPFFDNFL